jgi:FPC/CPF motif-containing protein YcgG
MSATRRASAHYATCYRLEDGRLVPASDEVSAIDPRAELVHDQLRSLVSSQRFSCLGAKAAFSAGQYWIGVYDEMASPSSTPSLARDLQAFSAEETQRMPDDGTFRTFIATFMGPVCPDEPAFEKLVWSQLQALHDQDQRVHDWDPAASADPSDPHFAFSVGGRAYFVVGLHAAASRWARRFAWPTLVFNPHRQFDRLREQGLFTRFRDQIRTRDRALQQVLNPMLSNYGEESEARQYAGRRVEDDWRCPFRAVERDDAELN